MRGDLLHIDFKLERLIWVQVVNRVSDCLPVKISMAKVISPTLASGRPSNLSNFYGPCVSAVCLVMGNPVRSLSSRVCIRQTGWTGEGHIIS